MTVKSCLPEDALETLFSDVFSLQHIINKVLQESFRPQITHKVMKTCLMEGLNESYTQTSYSSPEKNMQETEEQL